MSTQLKSGINWIYKTPDFTNLLFSLPPYGLLIKSFNLFNLRSFDSGFKVENELNIKYNCIVSHL